MAKKPTIAGLQRDVAAAEEAYHKEHEARLVAERNASAWKTKATEGAAEAQAQENRLRATILDLTTENARMRGYLDRIEDETPVRPEGRFSRNNEMRQHRMGRVESLYPPQPGAKRIRDWFEA